MSNKILLLEGGDYDLKAELSAELDIDAIWAEAKRRVISEGRQTA